MEKDQCVISEVIYKDGNVPPIIAYFENGDLKSKVGSVRKCGIFRNNNDPSKYIVAVNTRDNLLYMGSEPSKEPYRTLLAVQDRGSNKVRLIEVDKVSLKAKSVACSTPTISNEEKSVTDLYKTFGSKQLKRRTEQKERLTVNVESFIEHLQDTASRVIVGDNLGAIDDGEYCGSFLPCNRDATNVQDVYNLKDIISEGELQELEEESQALLSNSEETNSLNYSPFLNENLKQLNTENRVHYAQILLYAECLVQFLSMKVEQLSKKSMVVCPFSETINTKILDNFTVVLGSDGQSNSRSRNIRRLTPSLKNKALTHAIIAGLLACKFKLQIESLTGLARTTQLKLLQLCRSVGAVPLNKQKKSTIVLKLPLPSVPKPRPKRKS